MVLPGDVIGIRSMMFIGLSFDHRVLDGLQAASFLGDVKKNARVNWRLDDDLLMEPLPVLTGHGGSPEAFGGRRPDWLKVRLPAGPTYSRLKELMREERLHTVCEEAHCPNIGECWTAGTATFMILGDTCTRACAFCAVKTGRPTWLDEDEPRRVAESIARLDLVHAVITSVDRDDLPDGGAHIFAETIRQTRALCPQTSIEVLIPDFQGNWEALEMVMAAQPEILNHNVETVRRLYRRVRPKAELDQSLELLRRARELDPGTQTKTGFMVGLGRSGASCWS